MLRNINDAPGNVGAVARCAVQVGEQVRPDKAGVDGTLPLLKAEYVAGAQLFLQPAHHLGEGLYHCRVLQVVVQKGGQGQVQQLRDGAGEVG